MSKHTPGPWTSEYSEYGGYEGLGPAFIICGSSGPGITVVEWEDGGGDLAEANAHLIAAAPDLLDALKALLESFGAFEGVDELTDPSVDRAFKLAHAAIAKAEGK